MEAIRNYLETMFSSLPNTPEVQKAKYELWQMMEDKYTELKEEGKSENEAVGVVISEFGNLDELAESLGIRSFMSQGAAPSPMVKNLSMDEVKEYLHTSSRHAYLVALGVMLCILSPVGCIFGDALGSYARLNHIGDALGVLFLFAAIAVAVGLFIASGCIISKWDYIKKQPYSIDFATSKYVHEQKENYRTTNVLLLTVGVMLCIFSVVPSAVIGCLSPMSDLLDDCSGGFLFIFVAIGVFMLVLTGNKNGGYNTLLSLNNAGTMGANFVPSQQDVEHYSNPTVDAIMSVFWPTVSCLYLIWSFLSFDWHITWVVWPIAAIIHVLVKNILSDK